MAGGLVPADLATYLAEDPDDTLVRIDAEECERDLSVFIREAWSIVDPAPYHHAWFIDAIADHLMAVSDGTIRRLLINIPPRCGKSNIVSVLWPAWTWTLRPNGSFPLQSARARFLCLSYNSTVAMDAARKMYRLITSPWYLARWGDRVKIDPNQDRMDEFGTTMQGLRVTTGFGGSVLGRGGDVKIIDDANKPDEVESELVFTAVNTQYDEELGLRVTDPRTSSEVIIAQRLGENDLSGHVLDTGGDDLVHLCLPMEADPQRRCVTVLGWADPRLSDDNGDELPGRIGDTDKIRPGSPLARAEGALLWPEHFTRDEIDKLKMRLGPFGFAGRLQQAPVPRGGGILKAQWWRLWNQSSYPEFSTVLVSLDTSSSAKESNDEAALTAWGAWAGENGSPQIILLDAWEGFLEFDPLIRRTLEMCRSPNGNPSCSADILLVETKDIGYPVITEVRRLVGARELMVVGCNPTTDKVARAIAIQHMFSGMEVTDPVTGTKSWTGGCIWAPDTDWAQLAIDRAATFPRGKRKGLVDTISQAIKYLRDAGVILRQEEYNEEREEERRYVKQRGPRYDV